MKIHEYQAKDLFREAGIPAPGGIVAATPDDAVEAARALGLPVVLKAQVHSGGRGKAGGVQVVSSLADVAPAAKRIFALTIQGLPVRAILVTPAIDIAREVYLSLLIDRSTRETVFVGCAEGGIDIELTARDAPEKIFRLPVNPEQLASLEGDPKVAAFACRLFPESELADQAAAIMARMARLFIEKDCSLIEINPLVLTGSGGVEALDAKVMLDDNALFRHPELVAFRDSDSEDADELGAREAGLSFIRLDGDIGCMVNGAGLAMATMDTIRHVGGNPANFLDVGGSSDPAKVVTAFRMILKDPGVKVILINIFGGITRCDDIARGILQSLSECDVSVPVVIRLIGTNQAEGRRLLEGARLISATTLEEAAAKAVEIGRQS
ncbi:MAG TPA: ADP-forming succinate--CoA ligase subunit beta [Candidatus Hydrogenedentes bacterium]|jgi:succinyl-CoA synthetase beta subunit|nr:ADP-forming succinate--CoA ligase subunit beta [Candidatus Hydrogenedentota bacterium]